MMSFGCRSVLGMMASRLGAQLRPRDAQLGLCYFTARSARITVTPCTCLTCLAPGQEIEDRKRIQQLLGAQPGGRGAQQAAGGLAHYSTDALLLKIESLQAQLNEQVSSYTTRQLQAMSLCLAMTATLFKPCVDADNKR